MQGDVTVHMNTNQLFLPPDGYNSDIKTLFGNQKETDHGEELATKRQKESKKEAMKVIQKTLEEEKKIDQSLEKVASRADELMSEVVADSKLVEQLNERKAQQFESTGQEDTDIAEEIQVVQTRLRQNEEAVKAMHTSILDVRRERLKSSPMVTAKQTAEHIEEKENKKWMGEVFKESVEHLEEAAQEVREHIEEAKEKEQEEAQHEKVINESRREEARHMEGERVQRERANLKPADQELMDDLWRSIEERNEALTQQQELLDKQQQMGEDALGMAIDELL